ncbi:unnamed protein product [Orchesella dallaii]|uniref:Uncharacterized protein n=1 Tax=Orchesella dallaii TaxID=48710 RepID=A0ABP1RTS7_9HEXA
MSNESFSQQGKKPIRLDLQLCYSGFKVEELEYIDYSRANAEPEDQFLNSFTGQIEYGTVAQEDGILIEGDYEENTNFTDDFQSYLCSTPTAGRKHRGTFPMEVELSGFNEFDNQITNTDSGVQTQVQSLSGSIVSIFGEESSVANSLENLNIARLSPGVTRKKIELDPDIHDPYNVDEFELSIEEEISQMQYNSTTTLGTLRRRLSLKYFRRTTSTGLFGTYQPNVTPTQQIVADRAPLITKPTGPINLWFRKFRNRHFI